MTTQNIAEIGELLAAVEKIENRRPLNDHLWLDLRQGGRPGFAGLTARASHSSKPIAYCQISRGNDSWALDLVIDPLHRHETTELGTSLLTEAMKIIANDGGGHVHWWVTSSTIEHELLARTINFQVGRTLLQMRVDLPLKHAVMVSTNHVATQSFRVGIDDDAWLKVNNRAFADHPEQGAWTKQLLQSRQSEKWFDPRGFLLHFAHDPADAETERLAAFCWTKIDRDQDSTIGEIYAIAVDPQFQGRGLGKSLTVAGLNFLTEHGAKTGMLFVDKNNEVAVTTYRKLGFYLHHQEQAFVGEIASSR